MPAANPNIASPIGRMRGTELNPAALQITSSNEIQTLTTKKVAGMPWRLHLRPSLVEIARRAVLPTGRSALKSNSLLFLSGSMVIQFMKIEPIAIAPNAMSSRIRFPVVGVTVMEF